MTREQIPAEEEDTSSPAAQVEQVSYTFAGRDEPTLREISFELQRGTWTVLTGRTGSGKSTLLRILAGLIPRNSAGVMEGRVRLFGEETRAASTASLATSVGLVLQSADDQICTTTVSAEVAFGLENLALTTYEIERRITESLTRFGLNGLEESSTQELSGGQKQRLILASILAMQPQLLLLDEPLSQLDPVGVAELLHQLEDLRREGLTIVLVEHRLDEIMPHADRVLVMDQGRLVADAAASDANALRTALETGGLQLPEVTQLSLALDRPPCRTAEELVASLSGRAVGEIDWLSRESARSADKHARPRAVSRHVPEPLEPGSRTIRVDNLGFQFPRAAWPVFQEVSFDLNRGDRVALVGANGSGKSTLLAILAGLLTAHSGVIEWTDIEEGRHAKAAADHKAPQLGIVLQNPDLMLFSSTVREELAFAPRQIGCSPETVRQRWQSAAERFWLNDLLEEPPQALSQGQRLRTAVAATLTLAPRLLLLDEPTTGQDQPQVQRVLEAVGHCLAPVGAIDCLLFSTHDLRAVARFANRVLVLAAGQLLADCSPGELLADDDLLAAARLRRPPLMEVRHRLALDGLTVEALAREVQG
jgi:energy-coupling factor transporter ATP-binding protein EcfA2